MAAWIASLAEEGSRQQAKGLGVAAVFPQLLAGGSLCRRASRPGRKRP